jgi:hypothetical protein
MKNEKKLKYVPNIRSSLKLLFLREYSRAISDIKRKFASTFYGYTPLERELSQLEMFQRMPVLVHALYYKIHLTAPSCK